MRNPVHKLFWSRALLCFLVLIALFMQYKFWYGKGGVTDNIHLETDLVKQIEKNRVLKEQNTALHAEIEDLKTGLSAVESHARRELGLVKDGETYFQIIEQEQPE